ncbi:MAG: DUF2203 domain-containing protein [Terriglobales bacterium]
MKTFTLDEAHELLPVVESLLRRGIECKRLIDEVEAEFKATNQEIFLRGGMALDIMAIARRRAESDKAIQRVKDILGEIEAIGAQVKDLDIGLIDFPCRVDGTTVLLCWKLGEQRITHWHGTSEGFAGRKPLHDRIPRTRKSKPGN